MNVYEHEYERMKMNMHSIIWSTNQQYDMNKKQDNIRSWGSVMIYEML